MNVPIKVISSFCLLVVMSIPVHSNAWDDYWGYDYPSPNYGWSSSGSSKMECISRCTSAWASCNKICNMSICIYDEFEDCAGKTSRCFSQCNTEKKYCEAMCY